MQKKRSVYSDLLAVGLLILIVLLLSLPIFMQWQGIFHNDQAMSDALEHYFFAHNFHKGIIPLWNPHIWCGANPWYAFIYAGENYYVPLWFFNYFINPHNLDLSYSIGFLLPLFLHYMMAAIGMFLLLRRAIKCNIFSAFIGAFAYLYSPAFMYAYVSEHNLIMQAWLPWLIYVYIESVKRRELWKIILSATIFAFMWVASKPHYMPFIMIIWGGVIFLLMSRGLHTKRTEDFVKPFSTAFVIFVFGTALSAVYLYPVIDASRHTQLYMKLSTESAISSIQGILSPSYLITIFLPNFFGNITGNNFIFRRLMFWDANMSGGMITTLLVFLGMSIPLITPKKSLDNKSYRQFAILGIVLYILSILCALGKNTPFYQLFIGWIPMVGALPFPIRYRMIQCFAASLLIALGLHSLTAHKALLSKQVLRKIAWLYLLFSFCTIALVFFLPIRNGNEKMWVGNTIGEVKNLFAPQSFVGVYTPKAARVKKMKVFFSGEAEGEIRYADSHIISPDKGTLVRKYHVKKEGWAIFDVNIPPNKFLWIGVQAGNGNIGYWKEKKVEEKNPCFAYDNKWGICSDINAVALYKDIPKEKTSLFFKFKKGYIAQRPITTSLLYWLLISVVIIAGIYTLSELKFAYLLGCFVMIEFFIFGMMAFYGCTFNEAVTNARTFLPHNVRVLKPSQHPMVQTMIFQLPTVATNSTLRIAADYPFYSNFVYLNNRYALMGEPTYPLERRFKQSIEAAYERPMGPDLFYEGRGYFPPAIAFLSNFSVGYFLSSKNERVFHKEKSVPLLDGSNSIIHINSDVLPRIYTVDRVIATTEKVQMNKLVWDDLRKGLYINYLDAKELVKEGINIENVTRNNHYKATTNFDNMLSDDYHAHFKTLQEKNYITQINFDNPNEISVNINITVPSMLVFTEVWFPGWKATVDGVATKIYRVNYCQRGIWLGRGDHRVRLKFEPRAWYIGLCISFATIAVMIIILITDRVRNKKRRIVYDA